MPQLFIAVVEKIHKVETDEDDGEAFITFDCAFILMRKPSKNGAGPKHALYGNFVPARCAGPGKTDPVVELDYTQSSDNIFAAFEPSMYFPQAQGRRKNKETGVGAGASKFAHEHIEEIVEFSCLSRRYATWANQKQMVDNA